MIGGDAIDPSEQHIQPGLCDACCYLRDADEIGPPDPRRACCLSAACGIPCYCSKNWRCKSPYVLPFIIGIILLTVGVSALALAWPLYIEGVHDTKQEHCRQVEALLNGTGVEASCLFSRPTPRYCEAGKDNTQEEWWGAISSAWYCTCGLLVLWQTRHMGDAAINTIGGLQLLLGVGSFLFHFFGYHIYWILDVWPVTLLALFLNHALAERLLNSSLEGALRWVAIVFTEITFWVIFGLSYAYGLEATAPRLETDDKVLEPFSSSVQTAIVAFFLIVLSTETLVRVKMARRDGRFDDDRMIHMRQFYFLPIVFWRNKDGNISFRNAENLLRLAVGLIYTPFRLAWNGFILVLSFLPVPSVVAAVYNGVASCIDLRNKFGVPVSITPYRFFAGDARHPHLQSLRAPKGWWADIGYLLAGEPVIARLAPTALGELAKLSRSIEDGPLHDDEQRDSCRPTMLHSLSELSQAVVSLEYFYGITSQTQSLEILDKFVRDYPAQGPASPTYREVTVAVLASARVVDQALTLLGNAYANDQISHNRYILDCLKRLAIANGQVHYVIKHRACDATVFAVVDSIQQVIYAFYDSVEAAKPYHPAEHRNVQSAVKHAWTVAAGPHQDIEEESAPVLVLSLWTFVVAFMFRELGIGYSQEDLDDNNPDREPTIECEHIIYAFHGIWHIMTASAFYMLSCFVAFHRGNQLHTENGRYRWRMGYTLSFSLLWAQFRHVVPFVYRDEMPADRPQHVISVEEIDHGVYVVSV